MDVLIEIPLIIFFCQIICRAEIQLTDIPLNIKTHVRSPRVPVIKQTIIPTSPNTTTYAPSGLTKSETNTVSNGEFVVVKFLKFLL